MRVCGRSTAARGRVRLTVAVHRLTRPLLCPADQWSNTVDANDYLSLAMVIYGHVVSSASRGLWDTDDDVPLSEGHHLPAASSSQHPLPESPQANDSESDMDELQILTRTAAMPLDNRRTAYIPLDGRPLASGSPDPAPPSARKESGKGNNPDTPPSSPPPPTLATRSRTVGSKRERGHP